MVDRTTISVRENKPLEHTSVIAVSFFFVVVVKNKFKHHLKIGSKISSLVSFEDNFKYLGYLPFVTYFDFETTTGSDCINYIDDEEMYPFSDCLIFTFHPKLTIDRTVAVQSFQHTYDELTDVTYLKTEMIDQADPITTNQLRDCVQKVYKKVKEIFATSKIFSCELKFALDCFKKWHAKKYLKKRFLELNTFSKMHYEKKNAIDWSVTK